MSAGQHTGTGADAIAALDAADGVIPDGWTRLGHGRTRVAWLAPSGVVYKVGDNRANRAEDAAMTEAAQALEMRDAVPAHTLWTVSDQYGDVSTVLAMEHIPDPVDDTTMGVRTAWALLASIGDLNGDNIRARSGRAYVIDYAGMVGA